LYTVEFQLETVQCSKIVENGERADAISGRFSHVAKSEAMSVEVQAEKIDNCFMALLRRRTGEHEQ
jgi:hypothetical protein